jgi:hypothetical protein
MKTLHYLLACALLSATTAHANTAATPGAVGGERQWNFRVLLDGDEIGQHRFVVNGPADARTVRSEARFAVKLLFINAYRYAHLATERWNGECLSQIEAQTDDNGQALAVRGARRGEQFEVNSPQGNATAPNCVMSFAYWNPRMLQQAQLLNAQTGELQTVQINALGLESLPVRGNSLTTQRYALRGDKLHIDLWYDAQGDWVQLESLLPNGRTLRYQRQ